MKVEYHCSPQAYQEYFQNGAGTNYPVFKGYYTERGYRIGSLLINAMRRVITIFTKKILPKAVPLIKRGTQSLAKKATESGIKSMTSSKDKPISLKKDITEHIAKIVVDAMSGPKKRKASVRHKVKTKRAKKDIFDK